MCGIGGLIPTQRGAPFRETVAEMLGRMAHRGPDGEGLWEDPVHGAVMGHRRLAVLDLSPAGRQPMLSPTGEFALTFNGEIYNYRELRRTLEAEGFSFVSESDSEVILLGYQRWGTGLLERLVGMFAFAIWDANRQELFLARDRAGEKPLYYAQSGEGFAFASEVQALGALPWIDRHLDPEAVSLFLQYQYIPAPFSIYRGVRKLPPAHALLYRAGAVKLWRYWDPASVAVGPRLALSEGEALEQLDSLMRQAVAGQMVADVPLGAFLSGGIDSSAVVSYMAELSHQPVQTFTIGFEAQGYDESAHAAAVASHLGTRHVVEYLTEANALELIPQIPAMYGEPFADSSALPTHLVARVARKHVTVSLSGDGGDEAFGGYTRYRLLEQGYPWLRAAAPVKGLLDRLRPILPGRVVRALPLVGSRPDQLYQGMVNLFRPADAERLTGVRPRLAEFDRAWAVTPPMEHRRHAMLADMLTYMPEAILVKVDRAAMATSLESRAPLLDHRLLEFSLRLPLPFVREKHLLKELLYRRVPRRLLDRPKQGFGVPLGRWFRGELKALLTDSLTADRLRKVGIEESAVVESLLTEHLSGRGEHSARLWALLVLSLWRDGR